MYLNILDQICCEYQSQKDKQSLELDNCANIPIFNSTFRYIGHELDCSWTGSRSSNFGLISQHCDSDVEDLLSGNTIVEIPSDVIIESANARMLSLPLPRVIKVELAGMITKVREAVNAS